LKKTACTATAQAVFFIAYRFPYILKYFTNGGLRQEGLVTEIELQQTAQEAGLAEIRPIAASETAGYERYRRWLADGCAADMAYLVRLAEARRSPESILPGVKTLLAAVLTEKELLRERILPENTPIPPSDGGEPSGSVVPYACAADYHTVLRRKLEKVQNRLKEEFPDARFRIGIDSVPLIEKDWACRAGLGRFGKNSLLIHPAGGPSVFLGFIYTTAKIEPFTGSAPAEQTPDPCGECSRCVSACPVGALRPDRSVDARKCLNYWTIESRQETIPEEIRKELGTRLFGCDLCRRICPKNPGSASPFFIPLPEVRTMTEERFAALFHGTAVERLGLDRLKRNARWISGRF